MLQVTAQPLTIDRVPSRPRTAARLEIEVEARDVDASLRRRVFEEAPLRVLWPHAEIGQPSVAVLANTSGGVVGGDHLDLSVHVRQGAALAVTGQAAEKIYRASDAEVDTSIEVALRVEAGGWLEWLPRGSIVFDGARLRRSTAIDVASGGRCLAGEVLILGRVARGERWTHGSLLDAWRVRLDGRLAWFDALRLNEDSPGDIERAIVSAAGLGGATTVGTCVLVAADAAALLDEARAVLPAVPAVRCGVTALPGVLIARFLGELPAAVRAAWTSYWRALRRLANRWPEQLPRSALV